LVQELALGLVVVQTSAPSLKGYHVSPSLGGDLKLGLFNEARTEPQMIKDASRNPRQHN
jgi:hypothetical protein